MSDIVRITVEKHVCRYLNVQFGPCLRISDNNIFSLLLRKMFQPFDKMDPSKVRPDNNKYSLGSTYDIAMGNTGLRKYGGYMTGKNLIAFSEAVDLTIKEEMMRWVGHPNSTESKVDYAIQSFLDWYGFAVEEFNFDNAKRWYYRERERQVKRVEESKKIKPQLIIPLNVEEDMFSRIALCNPIAERQLALSLG